MNDLSSHLKWHEEHIDAEADQLKQEIAEYRRRLRASDHPAKEAKRNQLQTMLTRLVSSRNRPEQSGRSAAPTHPHLR